jgi:NADP-dependent 3-hydroxy acid dehydrogenase YdfG
MKQSVESKVVLITGASSGIGEATARHLASLGATVVLGARRKERLDAIVKELVDAGHKASAHVLDVTDIESVRAFASAAKREHGRIDAIVNNAGVMPLSRLDALRVDEWNRTVDVNVRGVLHGIAATLPIFKEQGFGHVLNVSSTAGHNVWPMTAVYSGSKYMVNAISEGLRQEHTDVRVTIISPGATESELGDSTKDSEAAKMVDQFRKSGLIPAEAIARAVAYAIAQPDDVDVSEIIVRPAKSAL